MTLLILITNKQGQSFCIQSIFINCNDTHIQWCMGEFCDIVVCTYLLHVQLIEPMTLLLYFFKTLLFVVKKWNKKIYSHKIEAVMTLILCNISKLSDKVNKVFITYSQWEAYMVLERNCASGRNQQRTLVSSKSASNLKKWHNYIQQSGPISHIVLTD